MAFTPADLFLRKARKLLRTTQAPAAPRLSVTTLEDRLAPALTGLVFQDYNANGTFDTVGTLALAGGGTAPTAVDTGVAGVTVTAFDANNSVVGTTVSGVSGAYTLTTTAAGPYRVEFTTLPAGYALSQQGGTAGTSVQFVAADGTAGVNLGVQRANSASPDNPYLFTSRYVFGGIGTGPTSPNAAEGAIQGFAYNAGATDGTFDGPGYDNPTTHALDIPHAQVGATWGTGVNTRTNTGFAAAYTKRHSGWGPGGPGAIYSFNLPDAVKGVAVNSATPWLVVPAEEVTGPAGPNNLYTLRQGYTTSLQWEKDGGNVGWDAVGKTGFGGLDVNAAGTQLAVVNLYNQMLYLVAINPDGSAGAVTKVAIPRPSNATGAGLQDVRPFAVQYHDGKLYLGVTNSAQSTGRSADLRAYVYAYDPATSGWNTTSLLTDATGAEGVSLDFDKDRSYGGPDRFLPWTATFANANPLYNAAPYGPKFVNGQLVVESIAVKYPQAMLTGLAFDDAGNLTLGFRSRVGDQTGRNTLSDPTADGPDGFRVEGVGGGDILKAFARTPGTVAAGWRLEQNGASPVPGNPGTGSGVGDRQGPGGGEFYGEDGFGFPNPANPDNSHRDVVVGGVLQLPGNSQVFSTTFDTVRASGQIRTGGVRGFNETTGVLERAYVLYPDVNSGTAGPNIPSFGKASGIGDLVAVLTPPIEIGNFIWLDANANGRQDAGEAGVANVSVDLYDAAGAFVATAVTDAGGNYFFSNRATAATDPTTPSAVYNLALKPSAGYQLRVSFASGGGAGKTITAGFADATPNGTARDSNAVPAAGEAVVNLVTGQTGADHTLDIGLVAAPTVALGNLVWDDRDNDGLRGAGEPGLNGVVVNLYAADGVTFVASTSTANGGEYYFRGLTPGAYVVEIVPPAGYRSSTGAFGSAVGGPYEPGTTLALDNADHGTQQGSGRVRLQAAVTLGAVGSATNPNTDRAANDANFQQDFGLFRPLSLGDVVWADANNNGFRDAGEPGLGNVTLNLRSAAGAIVASTVTNADGGYLFTYLAEGQYRVEVVGSTLPAGYRSSTGNGNAFEPAANGNDDTDHGTRDAASGVTRGPIVTLAYNAAPLNEGPTPGGIVDPALNQNSDRTQDFGFFRPLSIGDTVWFDANNDGVRESTELGVANVAVELVSGGAVVGSQRTTAAGKYLFENLTAGTYQVRITPPAGFASSTGKSGSLTSGPFEPGVAGDLNDQDHGTSRNGFVEAAPFALLATGNPDLDGTANLNQDFGLFKPLALGDLVWFDQNNDGVRGANEPGAANVVVELLDAAGTVVGTRTTNGDGNYLFDTLSAGTYTVRITSPAGFVSSTGTNGNLTAGRFEPSPTTDNNNEDHGTGPGAAITARPVVLLADGNPSDNGTANRNQDFGLFRPVAVGDTVWSDVNNDGILNNGETGLAGSVVELRDAAGGLVGTQTVSADGKYLFTGLTPGDYTVRVTPPAGYVSSTGTNGSFTAGPFEPGKGGDLDGQDHGTATADRTAATSAVTLFAPGSTLNFDGGTGLANLRQDFGFYRPLAVGNQVFRDLNNNGVFDRGTEAGVAGVTVRLIDEAGRTVLTGTTNESGLYLFAGLVPGFYAVEIDGPAGLLSSTGANNAFEPTPESNLTDDQDKGLTVGNRAGVIRANAFTLFPAGDARNPNDGGTANLVQDFGLISPPVVPPVIPPVPTPVPPVVLPSVGNLVFFDDNNDGVRNRGELGVPNVNVRLVNAAGAVVARTTTGPDGTYLFMEVQPGDYTVQIDAPANPLGGTFTSSSGDGPNVTTGRYEPALPNPNDSEDKGTQTGALINALTFTLYPSGDARNPSEAGTANLIQDFGLRLIETPVLPPPPVTQAARVSGYVYRDTFNTNGLRETAQGETGIAGVVVTLTGTDNTGARITRTTRTNRLGFYDFPDLLPGSYRIAEAQPLGFIDGIDTVGSVGGARPSNDVLTVTLADGDAGVEYNFGEVLPASIFGFVYEDVNRNRRLDVGEPAIPNTAVTISGTAYPGTPMEHALMAADSIVGLTVTTDAFGRWEFPSLPAGNYVIRETQPDGFQDFFESNQEPTPKATDIGDDVFSGTILQNSENRGPLNFGEVRPTAPPPPTDPTKQNFLGSSPGTGGGTSTQAPSTSPPISAGPLDLPLNPTFAVNTGDVARSAIVAAAAGAGRAPLVRVFDYGTSTEKFRFMAYETSFTGGVRVATADVNADGTEDVVTATGVGGGPRIRVFSGTDGTPISEYFAYESTFRGGVFVAAGDVTGDGKADIITGTEVGGGPRVTVFDGATGAVVQNFFAFTPDQRGGVRVAVADFNKDGRADIVCTTGVGVTTLIRVFDGATGAQLTEFAPITPAFTGGVFVAAGDFNGDGTPDIVAGADAGGGPHVQIFSGLTGSVIGSYFAYDAAFTGGVRVSLADVNGDGKQDIVTAPGAGGAGRVRVWSGGTLVELDSFYAFDATFTGGVFVG